jgi:hypothetical protein
MLVFHIFFLLLLLQPQREGWFHLVENYLVQKIKTLVDLK